MPARLRLRTAAIALLCGCLLTPAWSQPSPAPDKVKEARRLFDLGLSQADRSMWGQALENFQASRALMDRPSTLFNIGNALVRLGRYAEGIIALEEYMRTPEGNAKAARRKAHELLDLALRSVATVEVVLAPAEAELKVDGVDVPGSGARRRLTLDPGAHSIEAKAKGYAAAARRQQVTGGETTTIELALVQEAPSRGKIVARSPTAGVILSIDGREVGRGAAAVEVEPGPHTVEARASGHAPLSRALEVSAGGTYEVELALVPLTAPPAPAPAEESSILSSPWLWVAVGTAAAAAGGITIGVVASQGETSAYGGTIGKVYR